MYVHMSIHQDHHTLIGVGNWHTWGFKYLALCDYYRNSNVQSTLKELVSKGDQQ